MVKDVEMSALEEWGHTVYFVHHFEPGKYLIHDEEGLRMYLAGPEENWGGAYYELVED